MADPVKISELPAAIAALLTHIVPVSNPDSDVTERIEISQILSLLPSLVSPGAEQDIASAATVNLAAHPDKIRFRVTGATGILAFAMSPNTMAIIRFAAGPVITHNATTLDLPTSANITAVAGDYAWLMSDGTGNVKVLAWFRKDGAPIHPLLAQMGGLAPTNAGVMVGNGTTWLVQTNATLRNTLGLGIANSPQFTGLEIGHATDSTLTRNAAGFLSVEGKKIASPAGAVSGDVMYFDGTQWVRLAKGTAKQVLTMDGSAALPEWAAAAGGGAPDAVFEDQKASGTDGGTYTTGSWATRTLNTTVRNKDSVVSLSSNQFTPSVDGWVEFETTMFQVNAYSARLFNVTDGVAVASSISGVVSSGASFAVPVRGGGPVVAGKTYRIEVRGVATKANNGLGYSSGFGTEVYTRVQFWRF